MARPWYTYVLLFIGILALLVAAGRPMVGSTSTAPGADVGADRRLVVRPGSPLEGAGAKTGDRFEGAETVEVSRTSDDQPGSLRWKRGIPRSGSVQLFRGGKHVSVQVKPAPLRGPFQLAWAALGLLNVCLVSLGLALIWQRPRDSRALLLAMVLLLTPAFSFPREGPLLALVFAAHFFAIFPEPPPKLRRWGVLKIYLPFLLLGFVGVAWQGDGQTRQAAALFDLLALGYALYGVSRAVSRWRGAAEPERPLHGTLVVAAGAMLAAVITGISQRFWVISDQFVPANLLPAAIFGGAVAHLVFRLRALEVRVTARRTLQYLLARWTLGTLFLIPWFLLVWRFGQLSVTNDGPQSGEVVPYLLWIFLTAVLLRRREQVLRNLDRRFFRDIDAARQALIRLAQEIGRNTDPDAVIAALEKGAREALHPAYARVAAVTELPAASAALVIPIGRGEERFGTLQIGPKESGLEYATEERQLLEAAAAQAAMALENARLSAALLERQRNELAERTAGVLAGAEDERRRLAADLHDEVLPELRQIAGDVERLKSEANGQRPELERLEGEVRQTMDSVREVMEALRPSALDMLGLSAALESYIRKGAARCTPPIAVSVRRSGEEPTLSADQSLALYRICQEAINNVLKHSGAAHAGLEVRSDDDGLTLTIWDDGRGLDSAEPQGRGHGLLNMHYRADLVGASVEWSRREGGGTRVEVTLPAPAFRAAV